MKRKKIIILFVALMFIGIFVRIIYVNVSCVRTGKYVYDQGEECSYNDIVYKIKSVNIYDNVDDAREYFEKSEFENSAYESKILVIGVDVTYIGDQDKTNLLVSKFHIQFGAYTNGIWNTSKLQNDKELIKGQTKTVYLVTNIVNSKYLLSKSSWNHLDSKKCELVLSTYPDIIIMKCN